MAGEQHGRGMLCVNRPYYFSHLYMYILSPIRVSPLNFNEIFIPYLSYDCGLFIGLRFVINTESIAAD